MKQAVLLLVAFFASSAVAAPISINVQGDAMIVADQGEPDIEEIDDEKASGRSKIESTLIAHPEVKHIVLLGDFAATDTALAVAKIVEDYGLSTEVRGRCAWACFYVFLAGQPRTLGPHGELVLARTTVDPAVVQRMFEVSHDWSDQYEQASSMFDAAQKTVAASMRFMIEHGVSTEFALRVIRATQKDPFIPSVRELVGAGVLER